MSAGAEAGVRMMVCTAGHVDHGKTSLVKFLTGCDTDRLKEEKERGLTIELGFAPCSLAGDLRVGIVDVPGHEQFIRNMVSGVPGIDAAILVVAADDGVMPQTEEHLQILQLLGVAHGVVALSKTDLVAREVVERRAAEIREFLADTCLQDAVICPVSATTGEGFDRFYDAFSTLVGAIHLERRDGVFRMPVERTFSMQGFGTIVSGIPLSGLIRVGDAVQAMPSGIQGRVKAIQCFGEPASEGGSGQCLALNIPEFRKETALKGQILSLPGFQKAANNITVTLTTIRSLDAPVRNAEQVKFHSGTMEAVGKVYLLEGKEAAAGVSTRALIYVEDHVAVSEGDRYLIRRASPPATIGGGLVTHCMLADERLPRWRARETAAAGGEEARDRLLSWLKDRGPEGASVEEAARALLLDSAAVASLYDAMVKTGVVRGSGRDRFVHREALAEAGRNVTSWVAAQLSQGHLVIGRAETAAQCGLSPRAFAAVLQDLQDAGMVETAGTSLLASEERFPWPSHMKDLLARVRATYRETGYQSPNRQQLEELLHADVNARGGVLDYLLQRDELRDLGGNVLLDREHFRKAQALVVRILKEEGQLDSGVFKTRLGSTRKYALAVLDALDARGVTVRSGNLRRLAPGAEAKVLV